MKSERHIKLPIRCGKDTCAESKGVFCPWLRTNNFGQQFKCHLFSEYGEDLKETKDGWLARHPNCKKFEVDKT